MAEIVNLGHVRKKKKSAEKEKRASKNRAKTEKAMRESALDAHKRDGVEQCE